MKKFAKLLAMVLAVSMVLTMFVGAVDYTDTDSVTEKQADAIKAVYNWGIMEGYNNAFRPNDPLTRDEMAKIMYTLKQVGADPEAIYGSFAGSFADADDMPDWSKNFVGYASVEGIFVGNDKNEFNALGKVSYIEAAIVLLRALGQESVTYTLDGEEIREYAGDNWYTNAVKDALKFKLFANVDADDLKAAATRADIAVMIVNANKDTNFAAGAERFKVAELVEGVVTGEDENSKKEAIFVIDGDVPEVKLGDRDIADYIGKKISAVVEEGEIQSEIVFAGNVYDVTINAIAEKADKDDADGDKNKDEKIIVIDDEIVAFADEIEAVYIFQNGIKPVEKADYAKLVADLTYEKNNGNGFQAVTVIVNGDSISVIYAPIAFALFNGEDVYEKYDTAKKKWTGEWYYVYGDKALKVPADYAELDKDTLVAAQIVDGELIIVGFPYAVTVDELTASAKNGKYSFALDGKTLSNVSGKVCDLVSGFDIADIELWKAISLADADAPDTVYVYEDLIIGFKGYEEEKPTHAYAIFTNYEVEFVVNKDNKTKLDYTITFDAIVDGEETEIVYEVTKDDSEDVPTYKTGKALYKVTYGDGVEDIAEVSGLTWNVVTKMKDKKITDPVTINSVEAFYDATGNGYALEDLEVDGNTIKVDGKRVGVGECVIVLNLSDGYTLVIFDLEREGGVYTDIISGVWAD